MIWNYSSQKSQEKLDSLRPRGIYEFLVCRLSIAYTEGIHVSKKSTISTESITAICKHSSLKICTKATSPQFMSVNFKALQFIKTSFNYLTHSQTSMMQLQAHQAIYGLI